MPVVRPVLAVALCAAALGAAGPAAGSEVVASAPTPDPASSDLATDATGRQVAAVELPVGDGYAVYARARPRAGGPWGSRVRISGVTERRPADIVAAVDERGRAVVAWRRPVGVGGADLRYAVRPSAAGDWERDRSLVSALPGDGTVTSPALAGGGGRFTLAWGEVGSGGWQVRRAALDLASATPRTWSAGAPLVVGGRPSVAVAPDGVAAALVPAPEPGGQTATLPVAATTHAADAAAWEAPATLDPSGDQASVSVATGGIVVAAWRRGAPAAGIAASVRPGGAAPWGAVEALSTTGFRPTAAAGPTGAALVAYGVDLDEEAGGPDPTRSYPRGDVLRVRRREPAGSWGAEQTVFAVVDERRDQYQTAEDVHAAVDGLGTALLAWRSSDQGLAASWGTATAAALPFAPPVRFAGADATSAVALAPTGRGAAAVMWTDDASGRPTTVRTDRLPVAACAVPPPEAAPSPPDAVTLSVSQLRINQRIYSAAIRRADALDAWLAAGVEARDLCGGGIRATELGAGVGVAAATAPRAAPVPSPRPLRIRPAAVVPDSTFTLTTVQLRINQRIASRAVRQANALLARLDGGLSGGDVRDGAVAEAHLAPTIAVSGLAPAPASAPTRTVVTPATPDPDAVFTLTAAQLRINQRIGQAAIRRLNAVRARLLDGVAGDELRSATLTAADIAPAASVSQNSR